MPKVYLILTDDKNVLIGKGGRSGSTRSERLGYHLPGGKSKGTDNKNKLTTALRELKEETGIELENPQQFGQDIIPSDSGGAIFVIVKTESVSSLVESFNNLDPQDRPKIVNRFDEPFTELMSLPLKNCWNNSNFSEDYYTNYFGFGLREAVKLLER